MIYHAGMRTNVALRLLSTACTALFLANCGELIARQPTGTSTPTEQVVSDKPTPEQQEEFDNARTIITADGNTAETRLITAVRLLRMDAVARVDVAVELLTATARPEAATAMCKAVATIGRRQPELLDGRLVDPLLALLGNASGELSAVAASALAVFRDGGVAQRLGILAGDEQGPMPQRNAAIEALALNNDRRVAVNELIQLTTSPNPSIVGRALNALRPASRVNHGGDVKAWHEWWQQKLSLDDAEWLRDRLDLALERNTALHSDNTRLRRDARQSSVIVAQRTAELLRKIYQLTTQQAQRDESLLQWLEDPTDVYRLSALGLVREQINDGVRPASSIREAVKGCLSASSPEVRTAGVEIVGVLTDPNDAAVLLDLLRKEADLPVRETILRVLGRLGNAQAINALIAELKEPDADLDCVREAARSLGTLHAQGKIAAEIIAPATGPLLQRFEDAPRDDLRLREALLGAMAEIGDQQFTPAFVANLSSDAVELLLPAIRGIQVVAAHERIDRLLALLTHNDPRVRQLAADAVGALGSDAAHLEALIARVNPNAESNAGVREAAWIGFRALLQRQSAAVSFRWADRLDNLRDRQVELLEELVAGWAATATTPPELSMARERLWPILTQEGKHVDAMRHLQQLRKKLPLDSPRSVELAAELVRVSLVIGRFDRTAEIIADLAASTDSNVDAAVTDALSDFIDAAITRGEVATLAPLLAQLESLPPALLGTQWPAQLDAFRQTIRAESDGAESLPADSDQP